MIPTEALTGAIQHLIYFFTLLAVVVGWVFTRREGADSVCKLEFRGVDSRKHSFPTSCVTRESQTLVRRYTKHEYAYCLQFAC